jgi:hypothetical protein
MIDIIEIWQQIRAQFHGSEVFVLYFFIAIMLFGLYLHIVEHLRFIVNVILPIVFGIISICCVAGLSQEYGFGPTMSCVFGIPLCVAIFCIMMFSPDYGPYSRDDDVPWYARAMQPHRIIIAIITFAVPVINLIGSLLVIHDPGMCVIVYALLYISTFLGLRAWSWRST